MIKKRKLFYFVTILSFILSGFFAFGISHPLDEMPDSYGYDMIGRNLYTGNGYSDMTGKPTMIREPVYPIFLAMLYYLFGYNHDIVRLVQILLFISTLLLIYKMAFSIFGEKEARTSFIISAFFPTLLCYPSYILSETLFTLLLTLFVFFCMKIYFDRRLIYYILSGILLGILILCKSIMLFFIFILFLWGLLFCKKALKTILMILISVGIILPWMYRNYTHFDTFALREGSEGALCAKVQKLDYGFDDFKKTIVFTISEYLGKKIFPNAIENPRDFLFKEDILVRTKILPELREKGCSNKEIRRIMTGKIIKRPVKFLAISFLDLLRMTEFSYFPILNQTHIIQKFAKLPKGRILLFILRGFFRFLAYFLIVFSIFGMYIKRDIWKRWIFLFIVMAYFTITYSLIYGHGRYSVPLIPYYIIFSIPAVLRIKKWITARYAKI